jgi:hypothetical protein
MPKAWSWARFSSLVVATITPFTFFCAKLL